MCRHLSSLRVYFSGTRAILRLCGESRSSETAHTSHPPDTKLPAYTDRAQPATVSEQDAFTPGTSLPSTPIVLADQYFDGPFVGNTQRIGTIVWLVPYGIIAIFYGTATFDDRLVTLTFTDKMTVG